MSNVVVAKCRHDDTKYCKNWDGHGNVGDFQEKDSTFKGKCPTPIKTCKFKVTPTPSGF